MSRNVLAANLQAGSGVATVEFDATLISGNWNAVVHIASPHVSEIHGVRSTSGDLMRFTFAISTALIGKPYELDVYDEGEQRVTFARGVIALGSRALQAGSLVELEETVAADTAYTHVQNTPVSSWTVQHNLGRYPNVTVVDSGYEEVLGEVTYLDENTIQLDFSAPFGGLAFIGG